ncbi:Fc receptor-like protein 5 [Pelobates fuscus]|uniref:Fc receptor-like protein 5 n=1 Tax=Pelobates fuscus TaxID=191477 RepID=UPI002FE4D990
MIVLILTALLFVVLNNSRAEARPIISTKSDTGKIFTGESITLTCNMDSRYAHLWDNYNWYRDETKISKGRIYTINRATSEDSGDYTCTFKVITSYRSDPFTLKVSDDIFSDPVLNMDQIQLTVGAPMTLTCATRLAPYKMGTELQVAFYRNGQKVQEFGKSNQYRVKSIKLYHSGDYTCEVRTATDSVRKSSQKINIKIEGTMARPVISLTPDWGKIFTGESVTLTCNVGFNEQEKQKYYWYKDKQKISKSEKTFKIQSAITDDSGFYQCQTRSSGFSDPITLDVRNNDFILQAPNSVYEGDYLKLECNKKTKYSDFPPRFYHRDKLLQSDSGSNFHLNNAETSDSGTYRCKYNYYYGDYYEDSVNVTVQAHAYNICESIQQIIHVRGAWPTTELNGRISVELRLGPTDKEAKNRHFSYTIPQLTRHPKADNMGRKHKKIIHVERPVAPDIRIAFQRPTQARPAKMAPEPHMALETSEESQDERDSQTSLQPEDTPHMSDTDDDDSPSTKGDIKRLLTDLRQVWKADLKETQAEIGILQQRVQEVETREKRRDNHLHDNTERLDKLTEQVQRLHNTVVSLESRHRRRNIRMRGIPETVSDEDLLPFTRRLVSSMGLRCNTDTPIILTAFWVRKSPAAPAGAPRDTIATTRDVAARAAIMASSRTLGTVKLEGCEVAFYSDLPFSVLAARRQLAPVAKTLRDLSVRYRWDTAGSLVVHRGTEAITLTPNDDPETLLKSLGTTAPKHGKSKLFSVPHISVSPYPLTPGADMTLTCDTSLALLRADTELEFAFYKNGKMVQDFRASNTFRIKNLNSDLLGNYTCDAITSTRSVKKTSRRSNIKIAGARARPFITVVPNTGKIFKGESITVTCNPAKQTYQSYHWYKNSQYMYENNRYIIISAEKENSGDYQCGIGYSDKSEPFTLIVSDETLVRPVISVTPNTRKIFIGDSITLTCNVDSVSREDQNYYWYKDSKYVYITGNTFTIQSAEIDDSGDYQCETERGDQSDPFNLDVGNDLSTRVRVILGPPGGLITEGERLKVTCSVDRGSGNLEFKWCKQDGETCDKMYQAGSHQEHFLVESMVESYGGDYFCSVTANNIQVAFKSETVKISVHVPVFDARLHPYTDKLQMVVGDNMTFTCSVERGTTPHFRWWHNRVEVDNQSGMYQIRESGKMLYIESVNSDHEGKFYCKASNQISNKITTIQSNVLNVLVIVPVTGARIRADRDILEMGIGDNVTFTCSVEQGTFPFFLWQHNGKDVDHKSELYLIKEYGRILYIESVLSAHRGTYQCWTSNQGSNRNFTAESNVLTITVAENALTYLAPAISSFLLIVILTTAILVFIYRHKLPLPCTKSHQPEPRTVFDKVQVRTALGPGNEMNQLSSEDEQTEYRNLPARSPARDSYTEDDIYYIDIRCVPQDSSAPPVDNNSVTYSAVKCSNIIEETCKEPQEEVTGSSPNIYENFSSN